MSTQKVSETTKIIDDLRGATSEWGKIKEFAAFSGFTAGYVSNVVNGKREPSPHFLVLAEQWTSRDMASDAIPAPQGGDLPPEVLREGLPGERLVWARKRLGHPTQEAFAGFMGMNRGTLANYESGRAIPKVFLHEAEEKAGISRAWLKTGEGNWRIGPSSPDTGEVAQFMFDELGLILKGMGLDEVRLAEIIEENPSMPSEGSKEYAERLVRLLKGKFEEAAQANKGSPGYGRNYDPVRLLNLMDGLSGEDQAKGMAFVEGLGR